MPAELLTCPCPCHTMDPSFHAGKPCGCEPQPGEALDQARLTGEKPLSDEEWQVFKQLGQQFGKEI